MEEKEWITLKDTMSRDLVRRNLWDEEQRVYKQSMRLDGDGRLTELSESRRTPGGFDCSMRMGRVER
jgi:hypothetical protein